MLVEQCALAHHLDRPGATRVEHKTEAAIQEFTHPGVCQKSFLLASSKAEQCLRLAKPAGNFRMLPQVEVAAGHRRAGRHEANTEGAAGDGHQALLRDAAS